MPGEEMLMRALLFLQQSLSLPDDIQEFLCDPLTTPMRGGENFGGYNRQHNHIDYYCLFSHL